jgi:biopolymer transport protein ExbB/TolQ
LSFLQEISPAPRQESTVQARETAPSAPLQPKRQPAAALSREESASGTEVSIWQSGLLGLAGFVAIYAVLFPFRGTYVGGLLWNRGFVQFVEVLFASWSIVILVFKVRKLRVQRRSMLFDLLPDDISREINAESAGRFIQHIRGLPIQAGESFLVNRVLRGLEHFGVLGSSSEAADRLQSQSDIDANAVDSSYTLIKVFIWAIPILGFLGTVIGIGQAVGSFSSAMGAASDLSALKESFNSVTGGLSTAFDTTLLALVLSMFIMFPMSSLQKAEQDLLNWVDEYCNENLLKRLKETGAPSLLQGADGKALQAAVDAAMAGHHAEFRTWAKKLEATGDCLAQQIAKAWSQTDEKIRERHVSAMREITKAGESFQQTAERLKTASEKQAAAMNELAPRTAEIQTRLADSMERSSQAICTAAESLGGYFAAVQTGLGSLNDVLGKLGEKQVVVQVPESRRRWRLFG